jgi:hypothetical protein
MNLEVPTYEEFLLLRRQVFDLEKRLQQLTAPKPDEPLSKEEACELLNITIHGLNKARREGRLKGFHRDGKEYAYLRSECEKYLKRNRK